MFVDTKGRASGCDGAGSLPLSGPSVGVVEMACIYIILLFGKEKPTAMGALVGFFLLDGSGGGALG